MYGGWEGELWFHRWHMWPVPSSSTPSVAAPSSSFVLIDTNSLSKDGRTIHVGDCALFTPSQDSLPFVGIIRKLKVGKESSLTLSVNWLYRPADVKLKDGASFEAAPNEVFYSFHKDEIPAASLLHPCKVAFLRKGVELPSGLSSFVCRRVYDIESECLWWLTDRDYINDRQEEVNKLLDKTRIEMYGAVQTQTGGRSPKPLTGQQLKPSSDNVQNSSSSISSHAKSKKREHAVHKSKLDDADSGHPTTTTTTTTTNIIKTKISKITEKGGLVDFTGVEKLIQLMRPEETKLDLSSRTMLVDVISVTEGFDLLSRFVQIRGLSVLDEWLQEIHKGKIGDSSTKENEKNVEEFLFSLLRALERLPVNLHALQTCNVGKSVNHLRSHKNQEIQKKARSLVSTWKRRVEAEMTMIETKSSTSRGGGGYKSMMSDVRRSPLKAQQAKVNNSGDPAAKSPLSPAGKVGGGSSEMPSSGTKDGSSTQSPNSQSCSSDHGKISSGVYNSRNSSNGFHGSTNTTPRSQKENLGKIHNFATEKGSPTRHVSDVSVVDNGNNNHRDVLLSEKNEKGSGKVDSLEGDKVGDMKDGMDAKSASVVVPSEKLYEASYSSINALVESCAKFSEASVSPSDDGGMNLLASVAAGEMSRSDVSPECSPPLPEDSCSANVAKLREDNNNHNNNNVGVANGPHVSGDSKDASFGCEVKTEGNVRSESAIPVVVAPDVKPVGLIEEKNGGDMTKNNVIPSESVIPVARTLKVETQINEESASWSSSDMHDDDKKPVQNHLRNSNLEEPQATTSCGDDKKTGIHDSGTSVSEHSNERVNENIGKGEKAEVNRVDDPDSGVNLSTRMEEPEPETEPESAVKLDFDLNEDVPSDDGNQVEIERSCIPGNLILPSSSSPINGNRSPLITVPAKGPFYPSENLSRTKSELGWKGSAATSAFRPAVPDTRTNKPVRPLLDFDLNIGVDDSGQNNTGGGLDLDLNASQESPDAVQIPPRAFPSNPSRGFDLNGPGVEESITGESVQFPKKGMQFLSSVPNVRVNNNMDIGVNLSSWFPPNNTYPTAITIPEQSFVPAQRMLSPVLSSTPAVVPFQYSPFPFETNFPLPNAFPPVSTTAYVDAPAGGGGPAPICFPTQAQLVSMPYRPSYFMSLPGGSSNNVGKWGGGGGGLDLNAGPGGGEDKLAAGSGMRQVAEEQLKMFQQMAAGGGKRKEPDGGWGDGGGDRISYKHPSWQ